MNQLYTNIHQWIEYNIIKVKSETRYFSAAMSCSELSTLQVRKVVSLW